MILRYINKYALYWNYNEVFACLERLWKYIFISCQIGNFLKLSSTENNPTCQKPTSQLTDHLCRNQVQSLKFIFSNAFTSLNVLFTSEKAKFPSKYFSKSSSLD